MRPLKLLLILLICCISVGYGQTMRNKKYDLGSAGSSISIALASDAQIIFVSGTKTLSAPFSVGVTGTPVDGRMIIMFWDGTNLTTQSNAVTLLGATVDDKKAVSKLIVISIYKTNAWETRVAIDAQTTAWVDKSDLAVSAFDGSTVELDGSAGVRVKSGGITNTQINASAAIAKSKLSLTQAIDSSDIALNAKIPFSKMLPLTANRAPYIDANGFVASSATTATELGYIAGLTSAVQTQLNAKATSGSIANADISGSAAIAYSKLALSGSIVDADMNAAAALAWSKMAGLTASRVPYVNASGIMAASVVTATELGYLSGVTGNVQTQIDAARSSRTYTQTSTSPLVLGSNASDAYMLLPGSSPITVTLPSAVDFPQGRMIEFTRLGATADSSVIIQVSVGNSLFGTTGAEAANYRIPGNVMSGNGAAFISNGTDAWRYLKRW